MKNLLSLAFACIGCVAGVSSVCAEGGPNTSSDTAYALWADGLAVPDAIPPTTGLGTEGTPQWFWFAVGARRSYSLEIFQLREVAFEGAAMAKLGAAFADLRATVTVPFQDLSAADPRGGDYNPPVLRRYSFKDVSGTSSVFAKIISGANGETAETQSFKIRILDTTLVGVRVQTVNTDAYVAVHNSSDQPVSFSVHVYDDDGKLVGTRNGSMNARGSRQFVYSQTDPTYGGKRGSVEVSHNGAPGVLVGHVMWFNVNTKQYGPQMPLQESRSWGHGAY